MNPENERDTLVFAGRFFDTYRRADGSRYEVRVVRRPREKSRWERRRKGRR